MLGHTLRERRQAQGRTITDVAAATGIDHGYLSHVECGHRVPSLAVLRRLAEVLDLAPEELGRVVLGLDAAATEGIQPAVTQ